MYTVYADASNNTPSYTHFGLVHAWSNVREEPKASVLSTYKICDLAYKILKV